MSSIKMSSRQFFPVVQELLGLQDEKHVKKLVLTLDADCAAMVEVTKFVDGTKVNERTSKFAIVPCEEFSLPAPIDMDVEV